MVEPLGGSASNHLSIIVGTEFDSVPTFFVPFWKVEIKSHSATFFRSVGFAAESYVIYGTCGKSYQLVTSVLCRAAE
jgi:hypothetical protein